MYMNNGSVLYVNLVPLRIFKHFVVNRKESLSCIQLNFEILGGGNRNRNK